MTCVILPHDLHTEEAVVQPPHAHGAQHSGVGYARPRLLPADEDLERAAEVLNAGEKAAMLVGAGALSATDEVVEVAEILGAGVAKALLGKTAVPDELLFVTGSVGWLGTEPSAELMSGCDTFLMVGSSMPYTAFCPRKARCAGCR